MNLYQDFTSHTLVQGIGIGSPISAIVLKIQDKPALNIYGVQDGAVQDPLESTVVEFALNAPPPAAISLLVDTTTFTRQVDSLGQPFLQGFPQFDTTQMAAALGDATSFQCVGELRWQFANGEKFSCLDIQFVIWRSILGNTGTTSPVGIESYPDASTLLVAGMKDQPFGVAALDASGHLNPSDFDDNVVVLQSARDANLIGFAGLDVFGQIPVAEVPIDGVTIIASGGKLSSIGPALQIVSITTAAFTTPSSLGGTVEIEAPVAQLVPGAYYLMTGVGLYQYTTPIDLTHGIYTQIPAPASAVPGTSVPSGQPMQTSGPPGPQGIVGPAGIQWEGAWSSGTAYVINDVTSLAGNTYICVLAHTNHAPPNATYWALFTAIGATGPGFTWRGAWLIGTVYVANDVVSDAGSTWINILANTGSEPSTDGGTHWSEVAAAGTNGINGISFIWMGAWSSGTAYVANNVVSRSGSTYINILANTGNDPATDGGTHWALLAIKGTDGTGVGDMTKSVYDTASRGYVDRAVLADAAMALVTALGVSDITGLVTALAAKLAASAFVDAETSAGLTMLGSTPGQVKRLIAGTNVTLDSTTTPGGVTVNASGGSGTSIHVRAVRSSNWTWTEDTPIPWTGVDYDNATPLWSSGAPSRLTVSTAGFYAFTLQLLFNWPNVTPPAVQTEDIAILVNGVARLIHTFPFDYIAFTNQKLVVSGVLNLSASDYVEVCGNSQNSSAPSTLLFHAASFHTSPPSPTFALDYLGA